MAALAGCADKTPPPPRDPVDGSVASDGAIGGWPLDEVCMRASEALCARSQRCASDPSTFDLAGCVTDSVARCDDRFVAYGRSVAAGNMVYDPLLAEACYGAYATATCGIEPDNDAACDAYLVGTLPAGATCHAPGTRDECATGYCRFESFMCPGVCADLQPAGATCGAVSDLRCADGLFCDPIPHTCTALGADGDSCATGQPPCGQNLICLGDRCTRYKTEGEACTEHIECEGVLYCLDGMCRARAAPGGECAFRDHCPDGESCADWDADPETPWSCRTSVADGSPCTSSLQCLDDRTCDTTCTPYPAIGEPCDGTCAIGAWCPDAGGVCMAIGSAGDPCEESFDCEGLLFCDPGSRTCATGRAVGEPCIPDDVFSCGEGLTCDAATMRCSRRLVAGQACVDSFQCESLRCEDAICLPTEGFCAVT